MAKLFACKTFRDVTAMAQQVFGGVGFTLEYDIQLYFRRAKQLQISWWDDRVPRRADRRDGARLTVGTRFSRRGAACPASAPVSSPSRKTTVAVHDARHDADRFGDEPGAARGHVRDEAHVVDADVVGVEEHEVGVHARRDPAPVADAEQLGLAAR